MFKLCNVDAVYLIKNLHPVDSKCTGWNYNEQNIYKNNELYMINNAKYGMLPNLSLGGDNGHHDFALWLDRYLKVKNQKLYNKVISSLIKAIRYDPLKIYSPYIIVALNIYSDHGKPECTITDEELFSVDFLDEHN